MEFDGPRRIHIVVEMVMRILAILFGSFGLLVSTAIFLHTGMMTLQVPVIRFFTGYGPFYSGTMGYSNALASFGIIMQVSILIGRIIKCALKNGRRYLPVTIVLSFILALLHLVAGILCGVAAGEINANIIGRDGIQRMPTDSTLLELRNTAISSTVFSFSGMVLYSLLGSWEIFVATRQNS